VALGSCAASALAQAPVFEARVESVYVDVFVSRGGQPVRGLTAANFGLKDEGVSQPAELVGDDSVPLVAVLAFDQSASVAGPTLAALQAAGGAFLDGLKPGDEVALLTFDEEVRWASEPTTDRERIKAALRRIAPRGGTAALDGLFSALVLPRAQARFLVVLFSDGRDNASWLDETQLLEATSRSNALIHVVGIAPPESESRRAEPEDMELDHNRSLRLLAEATGGRFWPADSPTRLRQAFAAIAEAMGHRYVLRFEPAGDPKPGWHELNVKLRGASGQVQARRGYWVGRENPRNR
jgi:VWFA-related protein